VSRTGELGPGESALLQMLVAVAEGGITSRVIARASGGNVTLFAFDAGQELSEHTTAFEALAYVVDGTIDPTIGGTLIPAAAGTITRLPANVPHAVRARVPSRMLLLMLRHSAAP
jgi:quercetin dioxygenase-like cupin family protein